MENRFPFSKERIVKLSPPNSGRDTYYDSKVTGLQLRITKSGTITFSLYRRLKNGSPERITLGKFPTMTVEQARKAATAVNFEIEEGRSPAATKRALKAEPTLAEFFVMYGERHGSKKRTWKDDQQRFRDYLQKPLGQKKFSEITRPEIAKALQQVEAMGRAPATVRLVRALVSVIFSKAVEWGYMDDNPASHIKVGGRVVSRDRFLLPDELPRFFRSVAQEEPLMRDFILLALLTGVRRSNVCAMHWREINLREATWRIPRTKNGEPQTVTLCPEAVQILEERRKTIKDGYVFPGIGRTGHLVEPKKALQRVLKRAGIPYGRDVERGVILHDLRRTLGSWQARTGASLTIIGKSLNHKSSQTTAIYARLDLDPVRQSVNTATKAMIEAAGLPPDQRLAEMPRKAEA